MNNLEQQMIEVLTDLKENYYAVGVKAEFESEALKLEEVLCLKKIIEKVGLELTIKIGGCGSIRDINDSKNIGVNAIVAPMIESFYSCEKYIKSLKSVFSKKELENLKVFINIETLNGINCLEEILQNDIAQHIYGIILGRTDLIRSMGLSEFDINNNEVLEYSKKVLDLAKKYSKEFIVGGNISYKSLPFLEELSSKNIIRFETRKIIFDANKTLNIDGEVAINKALDFELLWINNKKKFYDKISDNDLRRIEILKTREKI